MTRTTSSARPLDGCCGSRKARPASARVLPRRPCRDDAAVMFRYSIEKLSKPTVIATSDEASLERRLGPQSKSRSRGLPRTGGRAASAADLEDELLARDPPARVHPTLLAIELGAAAQRTFQDRLRGFLGLLPRSRDPPTDRISTSPGERLTTNVRNHPRRSSAANGAAPASLIASSTDLVDDRPTSSSRFQRCSAHEDHGRGGQ